MGSIIRYQHDILPDTEKKRRVRNLRICFASCRSNCKNELLASSSFRFRHSRRKSPSPTWSRWHLADWGFLGIFHGTEELAKCKRGSETTLRPCHAIARCHTIGSRPRPAKPRRTTAARATRDVFTNRWPTPARHRREPQPAEPRTGAPHGVTCTSVACGAANRIRPPHHAAPGRPHRPQDGWNRTCPEEERERGRKKK